MKVKTEADADVNIASLIDCLMQCIIFFMVIMTAQYVYGVAIKFPPLSKGKAQQEKKEKNIVVFVQADAIGANHVLLQEGILKLNGEEIPLTTSEDPKKWDAERKQAWDYMEWKIGELVNKEGYKKDVLIVQGDMTAYHYKIMGVVDKGKANKIEGFSLVPPM
jgi:biopolymer transport protein ExbD